MKVLNRIELAEKLRISPATLDKLREEDNFPEPLGYMKQPKWTEEAIDDWLKDGGVK